MKIIVGLGNIGDKYTHTYHNMGFLAVECLADRLGDFSTKNECEAMTCHADYKGEKIILAKPTTFMNLSGKSVRALLQYYKCQDSDLLVIYDDIDIAKATIRYRESGSAGTHNGMRDIISQIDSTNFARIRVGVGRPDNGRDLASYVLAKIPQSERSELKKALEMASDKAIEWLESKRK